MIFSISSVYALNWDRGRYFFDNIYIEITDTFGGDVSGTYDNLAVTPNSTTLDCANITGSISNLCNLVDTDTNASTACVSNQVLDGDGNCVDISDFNVTINIFDQDLNTTDNVNFEKVTTHNITAGNITVGISEGDSYISFFEDGGYNEHFYWLDSTDAFYITDKLNVLGIIQSAGITSTGTVISYGDFYTTGEGDDLWLGNSNRLLSSFSAYADGSINASSGDFYLDEYGNLNLTSINISGCADNEIWKVDGNTWNCEVDETSDTNASTACVSNQVLDGDNNCVDISDFNVTINIFDQDLNTTDSPTFENITGEWFKGKFNWTVTDDWNTFDGSVLNFNESKLSSVYFNATQSEIITGTVDGGSLDDVGHSDGNYDEITFNFSESSGSPGLDLRINFTGVDDFNRGVMRYRTSSLAGDYPIVQMWNYDDEVWEDYPPVGESDKFATMTQPVFDSSDHLYGGVAMMRIYKYSNGNTNNHYYVDWIAVIKGYGTPSGEEVDPYSIHRDGSVTLTDNWNVGGYNITGYNWFVANESNDNYNESYEYWNNVTLTSESDPLWEANYSGVLLKTNSTLNTVLTNDPNDYDQESDLTTLLDDNYIQLDNSTINDIFLSIVNDTFHKYTDTINWGNLSSWDLNNVWSNTLHGGNITDDSIDGNQLADIITLDANMNILGEKNFSVNNNTFFIDVTNNRIGFGTNTPRRTFTAETVDNVIALYKGSSSGGALVDFESTTDKDVAFRCQGDSNWVIGVDSSLEDTTGSFIISTGNSLPSNIPNASKKFVISSSGDVSIGAIDSGGNKTKIVGDLNVVGDIYYDGALRPYSPLMIEDDVCLKDHETGKWVKCGVYNLEFRCELDEYCEKKHLVLENRRINPENYEDCHIEFETNLDGKKTEVNVCERIPIGKGNVDYYYDRLINKIGE